MKRLITLLLIILAVTGIVYLILNTNINPSNKTSDLSQNSNETQYIKNAGLTITVPNGYIFSKEEQMNLTTNKPYAVNFYIQNYKNTINETKNPYQLYAIYQWDTEKVTEEEFRKSDFTLDESTRKDFTVNGHPAVSGTTKGERGRFTTYILNNGHILTLAASETSKEQRQITESIIQSIKFD